MDEVLARVWEVGIEYVHVMMVPHPPGVMGLARSRAGAGAGAGLGRGGGGLQQQQQQQQQVRNHPTTARVLTELPNHMS